MGSGDVRVGHDKVAVVDCCHAATRREPGGQVDNRGGATTQMILIPWAIFVMFWGLLGLLSLTFVTCFLVLGIILMPFGVGLMAIRFGLGLALLPLRIAARLRRC